MPYLGISPTRTDNRKIDTPLQRVGGGVGFNGSATQFYLTIEREPVIQIQNYYYKQYSMAVN